MIKINKKGNHEKRRGKEITPIYDLPQRSDRIDLFAQTNPSILLIGPIKFPIIGKKL